MILRYEGTRAPLSDFGISIPAARNRPQEIVDALKRDPGLEDESRWLIGADGSMIGRDDIARAHTPEYVEKLFGDGLESAIVQAYELVDEEGNYHRYDPRKAVRKLTEMFEGTLLGLAGTYQCGTEALNRGFCFYLGGGAHHGHADFGHGFCPTNDIVIALRKHQAEGRIRTAWVIDVDAHKGDGTAALTVDDPSIVTLSIHMARGWPLDIPEYDANGNRHPSHIPSDIDIPIESGQERCYLPLLGAELAALAAGGLPDIAYVLDGSDPYEHDGLESSQLLKLTLDQMFARDALVFETLRRLGVPQAWLMAGGYGDRAWEPYPHFLAYALGRTLSL